MLLIKMLVVRLPSNCGFEEETKVIRGIPTPISE